jgi:hypothetical protein
MSQFDPKTYGPVFAPLLSVDRCRPLGAGDASTSATPELAALTPESAFAHAKLADREMAFCCIAGVWLLYDNLDQSHQISQGIDTPSGSFWHAIMHRREGDFSNAKYWFRRVGEHPVFEHLAQRAAELAAELGDSQSATHLSKGRWEPFEFVDLCEAVARGPSTERKLCEAVQQAEWELLFNYCYRKETGE